MNKVTQQIEDNINSLLDIYDAAMEAMKRAKDIKEEKRQEEIAFTTTERINYEMNKLQTLKSFEPEIRVTTSELRECIDKGRELQH